MIWWLAWSPFVGMLIARISRGRTIREFLFVVTSVVSAGFTLAMIGSSGDRNPSRGIRTVWGAILGALALAMIFVDDIGLVRFIIALSAIAFVFVVPILVLCLLRSRNKEVGE